MCWFRAEASRGQNRKLLLMLFSCALLTCLVHGLERKNPNYAATNLQLLQIKNVSILHDSPAPPRRSCGTLYQYLTELMLDSLLDSRNHLCTHSPYPSLRLHIGSSLTKTLVQAHLLEEEIGALHFPKFPRVCALGWWRRVAHQVQQALHSWPASGSSSAYCLVPRTAISGMPMYLGTSFQNHQPRLSQ